eukprot:CAMPEP_0202686322 /NCGR_PEP_ID=MMETSP1385-20130828/2140_1 /ASSEMBLY_ACC=CAM_ASM_000861 /TAXON_ID=933848 /ORGANISM="Elphidium margaritaceum" /LENGTH=627 /DNA_ID=CAMNT_0049340881 /DNA_START=40 /DNA_END=1923 /DNA_ORIENTATION=+
MTDQKSDIVIETDNEALKANLGIFNNDEKRAIQMLLTCKQSFIFNDWPLPGTEDDGKKKLLAQVLRLNKQYPPGIVQYYQNGVKLLEDSFKGVNAYENWAPSVPSGLTLAYNSEDFHKYEALGKSNYAGLGFVLVAGGLGERLGYSGIKVSLPIDITSEMCFLQFYISMIMTMNANAPLMIMTSNDTHEKTVQLLAANKNFGMNGKDQLTLLKQELVPTFANNECHFGLKTKYELGEKPHGHGDVHSLLYNSGLALKWKTQFNVKWLFFFQDTNPVAFRALPASLGVSVEKQYAMNTMTVPRTAGQAIGAITKLTNKQNANDVLTINVEYNQLAALLPDGDVNDPSTGYSQYPGNTNSFVINNDAYALVMEKYKGAIPEFVNPKYADASKTTFKKPTRLECMMQEYPKLLNQYQREYGGAAKEEEKSTGGGFEVGMTCFPPWLAMKPVKSNIADSIKQVQSMGTSFSAAHGEAAVHYMNRTLLRAAADNDQLTSESAQKMELTPGLPFEYGARVVLHPSFGTTVKDIGNKLKGDIRISERSTLVLDGEGIEIDGLKLDGALVIRCTGQNTKVVIKNLTVVNKGYEYKAIDINDANVAEKYRIRGYVLNKMEEKVIVFDNGQVNTVAQ